MKKVIFHVHTKYSKDSILTFPFLLIMCKLKKIDAIAITDHNTISGAIKYKPLLLKHHIDVIVSEEISTKEGEIIGLYLKKRVEPNLSVEETVQEIKKQDGLIYIPHPYDLKRQKSVISSNALKRIKNDVDFIECHNGRNAEEIYSKIQNEIAEKLNLRKIIGSDAHTFYELGRNYCLVDSYNKKDLVKTIENAKFFPKKSIKIAHINTKIVKLIKIIKAGNLNEISGIIQKKFISRK